MSGPPRFSAWWTDAIAFAGHIRRRFVEDRCLAAAASLSYTSLLALVPLTAIVFAVLSAFPAFDTVKQDLQTFVFENFMPSAVDTVQAYLSDLIERARGLKAIGIIGLAVTSLLLFATIETALNEIFRVSRPRPPLLRLLVFWTMLSLGPLLVGASFSVATTFYADAAGDGGLALVVDVLAQMLPTALSVLAFMLLYLVMPNCSTRISHALIGAVVAAAGFTLLRWGFTIYVTNFPSYQNLYGTLATIPIFLFWMYLSWAVVLAGAVITASLPDWGRIGEVPDEVLTPARQLRLALAVLHALYLRAQSGGGIPEDDLFEMTGAPKHEASRTLAALQDAAMVDRTEHGHWLAARDPAATTLFDVIRCLDLDLEGSEGDPSAGWPHSAVADLIGMDARNREKAFSVSLRDLLIGPDVPSPQGSAVRLHRAP